MKNNFFNINKSAAMKYSSKLSERRFDRLRHNLFGTWQPNPAWPGQIVVVVDTTSGTPSLPTVVQQKQGVWKQACFPGTSIPFPMPCCSKSVANWAAENGIEHGLDTDADGKAARFDFESKMCRYLMKEPSSFYSDLRGSGKYIEIQIMADAFSMFRCRPFTNLNFRIPQLTVLKNSPKDMHQIALYEGKMKAH